MAYIIFGRSGEVARRSGEVSTEEDTGNPLGEEERGTDHTDRFLGEEKVMPRERTPHR